MALWYMKIIQKNVFGRPAGSWQRKGKRNENYIEHDNSFVIRGYDAPGGPGGEAETDNGDR